MKHEIITIMAALLCGLSFFPSPAQAKYGGGTGEPNDPFLIYTAEQMNAIGADTNDWDKHFKLMADIDLSEYTGTEFKIIGTGYIECPPMWFCYLVSTPFTGSFDGNGHEILNFTYSYTGLYITGLFGVVDGENAEIKNLGLIDPNIVVEARAGSLVGYLVNGTITDCYVEGVSISGDRMVGGLIGSTGSATQISNCHATGNILGQDYIGGLIGYNGGIVSKCYSVVSIVGYDHIGGLVGDNYGGIYKCCSTGSMSATSYVGGLVGENRGQISNCYSESNVSEGSVVGGLVGWNRRTIIGCYSTGGVSGYEHIGGLVGYSSGYVVTSYWDTETSGQINSDGGIGKTTAEMQMASTFLGWGCDPVWTIDEGVDYPRLVWENMQGEVITNPSYWKGSGTETDPYLIYTADDLNTIGLIPCHLNKHFKLMADIDLVQFTGTEFNIVGNEDNPFSGVFDGNDHKISNFTYTSTGTHNIGLFGYMADPNAEIKDLVLLNPDVDGGGGRYIGSLVGSLQDGTISGCCVEGGSVEGNNYLVGGLVADSGGTISNCYSSASVLGRILVGGLVGHNYGTISNCCSTASVSGIYDNVGGLVGWNKGKLCNCYSGGDVRGRIHVGGLVGYNYEGTITNCYSFGSVSSQSYVGGLAGSNGGEMSCCYSVAAVTAAPSYAIAGGLVGDNQKWGVIFNGYSIGRVSGGGQVGGLVGLNDNEISNCYSAGRLEGSPVGGLVGDNRSGTITNAFWDMEASGQSSSDGGTGLPTAEMQMASTFINAGWDFVNVWWIFEGVGYPRHLWEVPVLHAEPEFTLGTSNTISWEPVVGDVEYYAECAEDADFTSIVYSTGWITETSCEFTGLQLGQRYWYSVKAGNSAGVESQWSNIESSLQCTLSGAAEIMLDPNNLKSKNLKKPYIHKINIAQEMIDEGLYEDALNKLQNDILQKTDGCAETGRPDKNDWIINCEQQAVVYPLIIETIEHLKGLTE